jgi:hypothetical protein
MRDEKPELLEASEREKDGFCTEKAIEFMIENPFRTLRLKFLNILYLFYPRIVPFHPLAGKARIVFAAEDVVRVEDVSSRRAVAEWAYTISYSFIFSTALYGLYLRRRHSESDSILYLIAFSFVGVYSLYWPSTRLRAPMDFALMFYSACALNRSWSRCRRVATERVSVPNVVG